MQKMVMFIIVLLLVIGGFFWWKNSLNTQPDSQVAVQETPSESTIPQEESFQGSLAAAVAMGIPMKCTYAVDGATGESYIQGKNFRATFQDSNEQVNELVMKDNCMWTWTQQNQGVTMCFDPEEAESMLWNDPDAPATQAPGNTEQLPDAARAQFDCKPAIVTDSMFTPPANIQFTDLSTMMNSGSMPDFSQFEQPTQ